MFVSLFLNRAIVALDQGAAMYFEKIKPLNTSLSVQADQTAFKILACSDQKHLGKQCAWASVYGTGIIAAFLS